MASRQPEHLAPDMYLKYLTFDAEMKRAGIDYILTCTRRTQEEQQELWAQGRTKPGKKVTWILRSKHIDGRAFDIAVIKNGKVSWNVKDYFEPGEIGKKAGLTWGGSWVRNPDYPHFEI